VCDLASPQTGASLKFVSIGILASRSKHCDRAPHETRSGLPYSNNATVPTSGKKESDAALHMRLDLREQGLELFPEDRSHE
jgi:hypothetical protein